MNSIYIYIYVYIYILFSHLEHFYRRLVRPISHSLIEENERGFSKIRILLYRSCGGVAVSLTTIIACRKVPGGLNLVDTAARALLSSFSILFRDLILWSSPHLHLMYISFFFWDYKFRFPAVFVHFYWFSNMLALIFFCLPSFDHIILLIFVNIDFLG